MHRFPWYEPFTCLTGKLGKKFQTSLYLALSFLFLYLGRFALGDPVGLVLRNMVGRGRFRLEVTPTGIYLIY